MADKIKVMIVDDSLSIRLLLKGILSEAPDMEVVATAADPLQAIEEMKKVKPDVMTLDVEMPNMNGIEFLQKIMNLNPLPVVMVSTLTKEGSETALKALEIGAVDVVGKPSAKAEDLKQSVEEITSKVRAAACAKVGGKRPNQHVQHIMAENTHSNLLGDTQEHATLDEVLPLLATKPGNSERPNIIAIGASTGGPQALQEILTTLPVTTPGVVITQHMAAGFTQMFAKRLDGLCDVTVVEAQDGDIIKPGHVYIAPARQHMAVDFVGGQYKCHVFNSANVSRHKPSVDVLFRSIANQAGSNALAIILTGMGDDGAKALKEVKNVGGTTIAQDESSSIVFGMPRVAIEEGGAMEVLSLRQIVEKINNHFK